MAEILGGGDTPLYTDAVVTLSVAYDEDLTGNTLRAYIVDEENTREEWGSGTAGANATTATIEDQWDNLTEITDTENLIVQWVIDTGTEEQTLAEFPITFTLPAHEQ